jgi:hypothetical protein
VDGLGAVDTPKRPDFWGQIFTKHSVRDKKASREEIHEVVIATVLSGI